MVEFVTNNMPAVGTALVALIIIVYALVTRQWLLVRSAALSFMLVAERLMATAEGSKKMDWVFAQMWQRLPSWLKNFVTEKTLKEKLQEWYDLAKNMISESKD